LGCDFQRNAAMDVSGSKSRKDVAEKIHLPKWTRRQFVRESQ